MANNAAASAEFETIPRDGEQSILSRPPQDHRHGTHPYTPGRHSEAGGLYRRFFAIGLVIGTGSSGDPGLIGGMHGEFVNTS
jgi:hypothetical protein